VVEPSAWWFGGGEENRVMLFSAQRESAKAAVIAQHKVLDLALIWLDRTLGQATFRQSIASRDQIRVGEKIFVLGHPERLFFTMSDGLVSRIGDDGQIQISAPISPGNSGGPVYDARGNLLAIVSSMVDRAVRPNAQNLNFAVAAEALLETDGWHFEQGAADKHRRFVSHESGAAKQPPDEPTSSLP
jgi:S1-C subfamily serine protease